MLELLLLVLSVTLVHGNVQLYIHMRDKRTPPARLTPPSPSELFQGEY